MSNFNILKTISIPDIKPVDEVELKNSLGPWGSKSTRREEITRTLNTRRGCLH